MAQMIDKCRIKIVSKEIMEEILHGEEEEKWTENTVTIKIALVTCLIDLYENLPPWTVNSFSFMSLVLA